MRKILMLFVLCSGMFFGACDVDTVPVADDRSFGDDANGIQGGVPFAFMSAAEAESWKTEAVQQPIYAQLKSALSADGLEVDVVAPTAITRKSGNVLLLPIRHVLTGTSVGQASLGTWGWAVAPLPGAAMHKGGSIEAFVLAPGSNGTFHRKLIGIPGGESGNDSAHWLSPTVTPQAAVSSHCSYVQSYSINFACFNDDNPFGYYYRWLTRSGYGDPSRPQWWACVWGSIHVCPEYEYGWSPQVTAQCGFPPHHAQGG